MKNKIEACATKDKDLEIALNEKQISHKRVNPIASTLMNVEK